MKFFSRLLLTLPFILVTFWYCKFNNPDENCHGFAHIMISGFFIFLLLITLIIALVGTFRKQRTQETKFEPITLIITALTFFVLIFYPFLIGHTKGETWIKAVNKISTHSISRQDLTLRKNGNFTIDLVEADFGCSISGTYKKRGDTILLTKHLLIRQAQESLQLIY